VLLSRRKLKFELFAERMWDR